MAKLLLWCLSLSLFTSAAMAETASPALVSAVAQRHNVPARIAQAVVKVESGYRCNARNGHARGIGQVFPKTAASVGVHGNLLNCRTGLEASMRYLHQALARGGRSCAGISLYNMGIYARPRCTSYGRRVLRFAFWR